MNISQALQGTRNDLFGAAICWYWEKLIVVDEEGYICPGYQ